MNYGHLELRIEELLKERDISKNTICKELDIPRSNFNSQVSIRACWKNFSRRPLAVLQPACSGRPRAPG